LGLNDPRGRLVLSYLKIVDALRPEFCVFENVRGIMSMRIDPQEDTSLPLVDYIVSFLQGIGYKISSGVLNAADFGVPQKRERFVILGCRSEKVPLPQPTHGKDCELTHKPWVTLADTIRPLENVPSPCTTFSPQTMSVMQRIPEGGNWRDLPLRDQKKFLGGAFHSGGGKVGFFRRLSYSEPAPTLVTSPVQKATLLCHPKFDRPLNIREYAAIQGFPSDYVFTGRVPSIYRQIGNAVPVGLAKAIGQQIGAHS
jgi:DNA (cytosine-5)-methyltransferase 1